MSQRKILLVEDETSAAEDIRFRLEDCGYIVPAIASSGAEALEKMGETLPDLVLLDIALAGEMDSLETAQQINDRYNTPLVYLTTYKDNNPFKRSCFVPIS